MQRKILVASLRNINNRKEAKKKMNASNWISTGLLIVTALSTAFTWYSLSIANNALKFSQQQFNVQNDPILEMSINHIDSLGANLTFSGIFNLRNYGNYPAKIKNETYSWGFSNDSNYSLQRLLDLSPPMVQKSKYLTKDFPIPQMIGRGAPLPDWMYNEFTQRKLFLYLGVHLEYQNLITKQPKFYDGLMKISYNASGTPFADLIVNQNDTVSSYSAAVSKN